MVPVLTGNAMGDRHSTLSLHLVRTTPYPCSYLPGHNACSLVAAPTELVDAAIYDKLIQAGFRRSGTFAYRPCCDDCQACLPARLLVEQLHMNRSQRRALKHHRHLCAQEMPLILVDEHYALYRRYQCARHAGGGMDDDGAEQYSRFLLQSQVDSRLVEFREGGQLRMVSVIDILVDGLSSVYCFYDPDITDASFGTYNILWQANCCLSLGLPHLYLGYWIENCPKRSYKGRFQPLEILIDGHWTNMEGIYPASEGIRENPYGKTLIA